MKIDEANIGEARVVMPPRGRDNLALIYQELLTVIIRLRNNRQGVLDAAAFRNSMKAALASAQAEAVHQGYTDADARLATFALVAFLDETVENARNLSSTDWNRQSLQVEMFGEHTAGEIFFQCIDKLMARGDSGDNADVLEVFALCILLGFRGRYGHVNHAPVRPIVDKLHAKIQTIRGRHTLGGDCNPQPETILRPPRDPWVRALTVGAVGAVLLALLFFAGFKIALLSGTSGLQSATVAAPR